MAVVTVLVAGCSNGDGAAPTPSTGGGPTIPIGDDPLTNSGTSSRTFTDPATDVELVPGEAAALGLLSPGGTGDRWVVRAGPDAAVAELTGAPEVVPTVGPPGSPDQWAVPIVARGDGRTTVSLELTGPDGSVVSEVTFTVVVS